MSGPRKEARHTACLLDVLGAVDNGIPRPSSPARITPPQGRKAPKARVDIARPTPPAHPTTASMDGVGEGFSGALPCSLAEAKAEAKAEVGPAPEEGKPVPHVDPKAEEKPAEAKSSLRKKRTESKDGPFLVCKVGGCDSEATQA